MPAADEVFIQGMAFIPKTITVSVNSNVTWTNKDDFTHTVTNDAAFSIADQSILMAFTVISLQQQGSLINIAPFTLQC